MEDISVTLSLSLSLSISFSHSLYPSPSLPLYYFIAYISIRDKKLEELRLNSLERVEQGDIVIYGKAHEKQCDDTCSSSGCWGPGPSNCVQCSTLTFEGQCVNTCSAEEHNGLALYVNKTHCDRCDQECAACYGPGPQQCTECKHVKDGPYCKAECPVIKYANESSVPND
eukprot:sb/3472213/